MGTGCVSASQPRAATPWEAWPAGSGVPHGRFLCLVSSSPLWSQRAGQSPGAAARKAGGRGGRLASGVGLGGGAWAGSDAIFQVPPEAGPSRCVPGDLPRCPFPRPLCRTPARGVVLTSRQLCSPSLPRSGARGPSGAHRLRQVAASCRRPDGAWKPSWVRGLCSPAAWSFLGGSQSRPRFIGTERRPRIWGSRHEGPPSLWPGHPACHFLLLTVRPGPGSDRRDLSILSWAVGKAEVEGWAGWSPCLSASQSHTPGREVLVLRIVH